MTHTWPAVSCPITRTSIVIPIGPSTNSNFPFFSSSTDYPKSNQWHTPKSIPSYTKHRHRNFFLNPRHILHNFTITNAIWAIWHGPPTPPSPLIAQYSKSSTLPPKGYILSYQQILIFNPTSLHTLKISLLNEPFCLRKTALHLLAHSLPIHPPLLGSSSSAFNKIPHLLNPISIATPHCPLKFPSNLQSTPPVPLLQRFGAPLPSEHFRRHRFLLNHRRTIFPKIWHAPFPPFFTSLYHCSGLAFSSLPALKSFFHRFRGFNNSVHYSSFVSDYPLYHRQSERSQTIDFKLISLSSKRNYHANLSITQPLQYAIGFLQAIKSETGKHLLSVRPATMTSKFSMFLCFALMLFATTCAGRRRSVCFSAYKSEEQLAILEEKMQRSHYRFGNFDSKTRECIRTDVKLIFSSLHLSECLESSALDRRIINAFGKCIDGIHLARDRLLGLSRSGQPGKTASAGRTGTDVLPKFVNRFEASDEHMQDGPNQSRWHLENNIRYRSLPYMSPLRRVARLVGMETTSREDNYDCGSGIHWCCSSVGDSQDNNNCFDFWCPDVGDIICT